MGFGGISPWSLLLVLLIVMLIFGTKRLRNVGGDVGSAIKAFKSSMSEGDKEDAKQLKEDSSTVAEGEIKDKDKV